MAAMTSYTNALYHVTVLALTIDGVKIDDM